LDEVNHFRFKSKPVKPSDISVLRWIQDISGGYIMGFDKKSKKARESIDETLVFVANGIHNDSNKVVIAVGVGDSEGRKAEREDIGGRLVY
jgi:hypothetical protein